MNQLTVNGAARARGHMDSAVIFGVTFINAIVGFLQESKAEKAIEALSQMVLTEATVRRDGRKQRVNSVELVPGDVVLLTDDNFASIEAVLRKAAMCSTISPSPSSGSCQPMSVKQRFCSPPSSSAPR